MRLTLAGEQSCRGFGKRRISCADQLELCTQSAWQGIHVAASKRAKELAAGQQLYTAAIKKQRFQSVL